MMHVRVDDLMTPNVIEAGPDDMAGDIRARMLNYKIHALPVVDSDNTPVGIITSGDLVADLPLNTPISQIMTTSVFTVPRYSGVHIAARVMRNHRLHHVVVTHENKVVGILSSFDLLQLVEEHRFIMKSSPTESKRRGARRA